MARHPIQNEIDFILAQAQMEADIAQSILDKIKEKTKDNKEASQDDYYEEKVALKMLEFFKEEEKLISLYAEAKTTYPILANLMENKRPYLKEMLLEAKNIFEQNKK